VSSLGSSGPDEETKRLARPRPTSVICTLASRADVEAATERLSLAGVVHDDISVVLPHEPNDDPAHVFHTKSPQGAVAGASVAGAFGGTLGLLAGIGLLAIPGLGPFVAAGPIAAALAGSAAGVTLGGAAGALVGLGFSEDDARDLEGHLARGRYVLSVRSRDRQSLDLVVDILRELRAEDICVTRLARVSSPGE
jgi:hypothetical protein